MKAISGFLGDFRVTAPMAITFGLLVTLPLWIKGVGLYQYLGIEVVIWMIYALGFNLLLGYSGLASFGHGAFFGVGAYAFGLAQLHLMQNVWLSIFFAVAAAAVAGAVVAAFISHRRGIYYTLMTIAFGQVAWFIAIKWHRLTGGEDGLLNVFRPKVDFGFADFELKSNVALYYFVLAFLVAVVLLLWRLIHSPFGKVIQAIRQNELRASFVGHNVWLFKWIVFALSAGLAGLAGALFTMAQESAYPDVMALHVSGTVVMITLVGGGLVSFWGPVVGTVVFFLARDLLGTYTETWLLWFGLMFIAVVVFRPEGIVGAWRSLLVPRPPPVAGGRPSVLSLLRR